MAIAVTTEQAWVQASDATESTESASISVASGDWLVAVGVAISDGFGLGVTDSYTASWTIGGTVVDTIAGYFTGDTVITIAARRATSSTSWTAKLAVAGYGVADPAIKVYKVTGAATSPFGATVEATGGTNVKTVDATIQDSGSVLFGIGMTLIPGTPSIDFSTVSYTTSDGGYATGSGYSFPGATGTYTKTYDAAGSSNGNWYVAELEMKPAGGTSHSASASVSTTDTLTAAATVTRFGAAAVSETAAITAAAAREAFGAAALSIAGAVTAAATRTQAGAAAVDVAATITASATVETPGSVTTDAAFTVTDAITAAATLTGVAVAAVSTTATVTATADVVTTHSAAASRSVTVSITASAVIVGEEPTTAGFMRGVELSQATMRPATGAASVPVRVALLNLDVATMTAVVSTSATPSQLGIPIFAGGSVSPFAAGLIGAGLPYIWIDGDDVWHRETGT